MERIVRRATGEDKDKILSLLERTNLVTDGVVDFLPNFFVLENDDGSISGTIGIEISGKYGLLRSFVLSEKGDMVDIFNLFQHVFLFAENKGLESLYLSTNVLGSVELFQFLGFEKENINEIPQEIRETNHFATISSVDNLLVMKKLVGKSG